MQKNKQEKKDDAKAYLKKLEEKLRYYKKVVIDSSDAIIIQDFNGIVKAWNKSAERIYGFKEKEMLGKNIIKIIAKKDRLEAKKNIKFIKYGKPAFKVRQARITKDNKEISVIITYSPIYENKEIIEVATTAEDVSGLKKRLKEAERIKQLYTHTLDNMMEGCMIIDFNWRYLYVNNVAAKHGHQKQENLIGRTMLEIYPGVEKSEIFALYQHCMKKRVSGRKELAFTFPRGLVNWYELNVSPVPEGIFVLSIDITERKEAEERTKKSENKYRGLVENLQEGLWILDKNDKTVSVNKQMADMLGYKISEMIGKKVFFFMDERGADMCKQRLKARKQGVKEKHEFELIHKSGRRVYVLMNASSILDEKGKYIQGFSTVIDITEKKKANDEILKKNKILQMISSVNQAIFLIRNKEKLLSKICEIINEYFYKMVWIGLCDEQTKKVIPVAYAGFEKGYLEKITIKYDLSKYGKGPTGTAIRTKKPSIMRNIDTDKRYTPWRGQALKRGYHSSVALPIFRGNYSIGAINVYSEKENGFSKEDVDTLEELAKDISVALERFKGEEKFKRLFETAQDGILLINAQTAQIEDVNPYLIKMLGYTQEQFLGKKLWEIGPFRNIKESKTLFKKLQDKGYVRYDWLPLEARDGRKIDVEFVSDKYFAEGKLVIQCNIRNITEQKEVEEKITISEEKYRILTEASPDCIKLFDTKGNLIFINKAGLREHRIKSLKEAIRIGWKAVESVIPEDRVKFSKALSAAMKGEISVIEIKHTKKGSLREYCEETIVPIRDADNKTVNIYAVSRNISARKKAEEKLKQVNEELEEQQEAILNVFDDIKKEKEKAETYLNIAGNIILTLDKKGNITLINKKGNEVLGYKNGDLIGKNWFNKCLPKDNLKIVKAVFEKLMSGGDKVAEKYENPVISKTGEQKIILWHNSILRDNHGNVTGTLSSGEDITELKKIDKAKTEFVSLASHQLRTPLAAVNWYGEMLKGGDVGILNKEQQKYINHIYDSNRRMADLVSALLNVSRIELGTFIIEPALFSLRKIVESVANEMKQEIVKKKIYFKVNFGRGIPKKMMLDEKLIRMIITNLLSNAVKYTPKNGRIRLQLDKRINNIAITIKDTGYGIPVNQQNMMFTKLFRADNIKKRDTSGTGLGLYIVKSILDQVGGKIWFKSKENKGSVFYITIPLEGFAKKEGTKYLE